MLTGQPMPIPSLFRGCACLGPPRHWASYAPTNRLLFHLPNQQPENHDFHSAASCGAHRHAHNHHPAGNADRSSDNPLRLHLACPRSLLTTGLATGLRRQALVAVAAAAPAAAAAAALPDCPPLSPDLRKPDHAYSPSQPPLLNCCQFRQLSALPPAATAAALPTTSAAAVVDGRRRLPPLCALSRLKPPPCFVLRPPRTLYSPQTIAQPFSQLQPPPLAHPRQISPAAAAGAAALPATAAAVLALLVAVAFLGLQLLCPLLSRLELVLLLRILLF